MRGETVVADMELTERQKVAHLLRRFGLGASEAELDYYGSGGLKGATDKLIDYEKVDEGFDVPITLFRLKDPPIVPMQAVVAHWVMRLLVTRRPLQEKMTLFWHDHFATSAIKVNLPPLMFHQIETLRSGALGSFSDLLLNVSKDPGMLFWLDNQYNVVGKPNENFAREVMELFTLGIGHYSEKDVQETARAFTGWTFRRRRLAQQAPDEFQAADFLLSPRLHDNGEKTILGKTGNFGGEDVLKLLCENPQTPKHITEKMWTWFGYENPEPRLIERLASGFTKNGLSIKWLVRSIMESPEFYSEKAFRKVYKNPVDFVTVTMRQMGYGEILGGLLKQATAETGAPLASRLYSGAASQALQAMGMQLMFPPDVNGWEGGQAWITSATMVERIGWADRLFGQAQAGTRRAQLQGINVFALFEKNPTPEAVARQLASIFDAPLPEAKMKSLVEAAKKASGGRVTPANANEVAAKVCRLIFGSPEFQFA